MTYHQVSNKGNRTGATSGAVIVTNYLISRAPTFIPLYNRTGTTSGAVTT